MNEQVESYIKNFPIEIIECFLSLRSLIYESISVEPRETVWARMPSYYVDDSFVRIILFKDHINVEADAIIKHTQDLSGYKITPKGMLQIYLHQTLPTEILRKIIIETLEKQP